MIASQVVLLLAAGAFVGSIEAAATIKHCAVSGLLERIDPLEYFASLELDSDRTAYSGYVRILIGVNETQTDEPKNVIVLNVADDIDIFYGFYSDDGVPEKERRVFPIKSVCRDHGKHLIEITFTENLHDGSMGALTLMISGVVRDGSSSKGIFRHKPTNEDNSTIKADFSNSGAQLAMPSFDDPQFKASFALEIVTKPGWLATSSTLKLKASSQVINGVLHQFKTSSPMELGRVSFAIRPLPTEATGKLR